MPEADNQQTYQQRTSAGNTAEADELAEQPAMQVAEAVDEREETPEHRGRPQGFVVRILLVSIAFVAVCGIAALLIFNNMRSSRNAPLEIELYPNAVLVSESVAPQQDERNYATMDSIDAVYRFYSERLGEMPFRTFNQELGDDRDRGCRKVYFTDPPSEEVGQYNVRCFIDNSQNDVTQLLRMTIEYNPTENLTLIKIERQWGS